MRDTSLIEQLGGTSVEIDPFIYETDVLGSMNPRQRCLRRAGCVIVKDSMAR